MVLNSMLDRLFAAGVTKVVLTSDTEHLVTGDLRRDAVLVQDVRSATFLAMGMSQTAGKAVVLIVRGEYLANCYTGIVEAWFQRMPLIVLSIHAGAPDNTYMGAYLRRVVRIAKGDALAEGVEGVLVETPGPSLLEVLDTAAEERRPVADLSILSERIPDGWSIVCGGADVSAAMSGRDPRIVAESCKYGVLSKHAGAVAASKTPSILVVPSSWALLDLNVLGARCIGDGFRVVLVGPSPGGGFAEWAASNGVSLHASSSRDREAIEAFLRSSGPSLLLVEE